VSTSPQGAGRVVVPVCLFSLMLFANLFAVPALALDRTWIGGNVDWVDAGAATNWNPNDEPDSDDRALFNTANTVNLGSNNAVNGLALSGGIDLFTNDFDLTVDGLAEVAGVGSNLFVDDNAGSINADDVTINADGTIELRGGTLTLDEEVGTSLLDINVGGDMQGRGTITFADTLAGATTLLINDGTLTALSRGLTIFSPPPVGTLQINDSDVGGRVDLDGSTELGVVNVNRHQTLDLNIPLADNFNGTLNLFQESTFDSVGWGLAGGSIVVNNGFVDNVIPNPDIPAGTSFISGGLLVQSGGTINVVDTDGTLQFDAPFTMNGGSLTNNGHVIFNQTATIAAAANFMMIGSADLTVEANRTVNVDQSSFNLDGSNTLGTVITVNSDATLELNLGDYDNDSATNAFDATISLNSGSINVDTSDAEFVMDGTLNMNNSGATVPEWSGEPLDIGNDAGALDAKLNIGSAGNSIIHAQVDFNSDADVDIAAGSALVLTNTVNFNPVNGGNNAQFTGAGTIAMNGQVNFNEATTFNMTGGTVDFDGLDTANGDTLNVDAPVTVNAATMGNFGKVNTAGVNTLDINNSVGLGVLTVNLDNAADEWTLNGPGVMNLVNDSSEATLLAGSDVNVNGTINVTGDVRSTARLDIGSTAIVNISTAGQPLRLAGGDNLSDPNTLAGGTISGAGILGADTGKALHGFGTINTSIEFVAASNLFADDGTLTINGTIVDVARIGTFDADGVLNVVNAWDTAVAGFVTLEGGTIQGGTMTINNLNGVSGEGLITARLINNVRLRSSDGTLVAQTAGNDNDWDGAAGSGVLAAINAGTLEIRDEGAAFGFTGTVEASTNSRVFANGFALDFNPGSTLDLTSSTYESTSSTDIGGTVTVNAGAESSIKVSNNSFLTFETGSNTALTGNLRLENNNINIEQGAVFVNNGGALVIPDGSHLVADNLADIGVLLDMQGAFRPGNFNGIGRIDLLDYQQANTGELFIEIKGTALNAFDRLVADGDVVLDGYLNIDIDEISPGVPFVPILGQTFNIITGNTVTGEFDYADVSGMPAGLAFHIEYLSNVVQLQVVTKPIFSADFDDDGDVDATDLAIWQGAYNLNQLGDADGDNDSDGRDFMIWQRQHGSAPLTDLTANSTAVPEPTSTALVALLALMAVVRRDYHQ
jgi:hypothetical protein